jgi:hypothetical protein
MKKSLLTTLCTLSILLPDYSKAGSVTVEDFSVTAFYPASTPITGTISAMWGSYSGGVFSPFFSSTQSAINTGYLDGAGNELAVVLTQSDNNTITAGANLFVSIFNVPGGSGTSTWNSGAPQIILSDPTWVAPTFTLTTPTDVFGLTASTVALPFNGATGTYSFNAGSPSVTLAVPEPSTYALLSLFGIALGGYAYRRRVRG